MKRIQLHILLAGMLAASCTSLPGNPYEASLCRLEVSAQWPEGFEELAHEGVEIVVEDINLGHRYRSGTDASGKAEFKLSKGIYRISLTDIVEDNIFNGTLDRVIVEAKSNTAALDLIRSKAGSIIIKEIYCGGCMKTPEQGTYITDQYVILHNNDYKVQYLDGLCFGSLFPYNSYGANPFLTRDEDGNTIYPSYVPVTECIWRFPGDGTSFPLQPGEDAVLVVKGAIDHSASYPLSVNLNKEGYFVCYNSTYFTNTSNHPVPGDKIDPGRYLDVLVKTGKANAYTFSISSPAVVLFRLDGDPQVCEIPGKKDKVSAVPLDSIIDAVEVFSGTSSANAKRLVPTLDAGFVTLTDYYLGRTLMRKTDEELSESAGYEILTDTNNSSNDFYERKTQSLHD